ncbi:hypothetical protein ACFLTK_02230 [Chloroflexota bacterium]
MQTKYEGAAYQFLSVYRFLAYALAVMFMQIIPSLSVSSITDRQVIVILSILGVYTVLKVFSPLRWRERSQLPYLILIGDFLLAILLVIFYRWFEQCLPALFPHSYYDRRPSF